MKYQPLHDSVMLRPTEPETKTKGGIILPDSAVEKPIEAQVIAVGAGRWHEDGRLQPLDVRVGEMVIFSKWSGTEVTVDGEKFLIMKESDIVAVLRD